MKRVSLSVLEKLVPRHLHSPLAWMIVCGTCFASYIYLSNAFTGQNLHVWGDEITYSMETRNRNFSTSTYPVYLYLSVFSIAHLAGNSFLEFARNLNALIIILALPFLYLTARAYASRRWSCVVVLATAISPITTYAAYFMPDAMFFAVFLVYAWFCITGFRFGPYIYGIGVGSFAGTLALVKPHGLFVFSAFLTTQFLFLFLSRTPDRKKNWLIISALSILLFLFVRLGVAHIMGGKLGLLGSYSDWSTAHWSKEKYFGLIYLGLTLIKGHVIGLLAVTGPCLLALFLPLKGNDTKEDVRFLQIFALCNFGLMFAITILFSMRISDDSTPESNLRLHMRYYNYLFPIFYVLLLSRMHEVKHSSLWVRITIVILAACAFSIGFGSLDTYFSLPLDAPELRGLSSQKLWLQILGFLIGLSLLSYLVFPSRAIKFYLISILPITALIGAVGVNRDLAGRVNDMPGDAAGKTVRAFLGTPSKRIGFFGNIHSVNQAEFYAGGLGSYTFFLEDNDPMPDLDDETIYPKLLPSPLGLVSRLDVNWILVFGKREISDHYVPVLKKNDEWALYRKKKGRIIGSAHDLTDLNWTSGMSNSSAAFFVENSAIAKAVYKPGATLQFADGQVRSIVSVTTGGPYLNVFLDGASLDGKKTGFPHEIELYD